MREIKFRAWDTFKKEMILDVQECWSDVECCKHCFQDFLETPYILQQYTGLKDKNGKEIYEGDYGKDEGGNICKIFWNDSSSGFDADFPNAEMFSVVDVATNIEVIGNIYENPELLK